MLARGRAPGLAFAVLAASTGCSFDSSGALFGSAGDGGEPAADARTAVDAGPRPDARPGKPDAAPTDADGTLYSAAGTVDMYDGDLDDWDAVGHQFAIDEGMDFHPIAGYSPSATLTFASMHDDTYIYFALVVEDDEVLPAAHPLWRDDSIEIYIDAAADRSGPFGDDDHEIIIGSNGTYLDYAPGAVNAEVSGNAFRIDGGYALEIGISKDSLGVDTLPNVLGFAIAINDDDTMGDAAFGLWYRRSASTCADCCSSFEHPEAWCDTSILGSLVLE